MLECRYIYSNEEGERLGWAMFCGHGQKVTSAHLSHKLQQLLLHVGVAKQQLNMQLWKHSHEFQHAYLYFQSLLRREIVLQALTHIHPVVVVQARHLHGIVSQPLDHSIRLSWRDE